MAYVDGYVAQIRSAVYGRDVRDSIANAIEAINNDVVADTASTATNAAAAAQAASSAAEAQTYIAGVVDELSEIIANEEARQAAEELRESAETGYVAQAQAYAEQAASYATSDYVTEAKSWAIGGTGSRLGEDTNNAKYWANGDEINPDNQHSAKWWADNAAQVVTDGGVASFNGRTGIVTPNVGDYSASMISYGSGTVESVIESINSNVNYPSSRNPDSNDFNDFTEPGKYAFGTGEQPLNGPNDNIWDYVLLVVPNKSGNFIHQFCVAMSGVECYERYYARATGWSQWIRIDNLGSFVGKVADDAIQDFNQLTFPGTYEVSGHIGNRPGQPTSSYQVMVYASSDLSTCIRQVAWELSSSVTMWTRVRFTSPKSGTTTWSSWSVMTS